MNTKEIILTGQYCNGMGVASKTVSLQAEALQELGHNHAAQALNSGRAIFRGTVNMKLPPNKQYLVKRFSLFFHQLNWDKEHRYIKKKTGENIGLVKINSIKVDTQLFANIENSYLYFGLRGGHYKRGDMLEILTPIELPVHPQCSLAISVNPDFIETGHSKWFKFKRKTVIKLRKLFKVEDGHWFKWQR